MKNVVALLVDIVDSRKLVDRAATQRAILATFRQVNDEVIPVRPAWATVADEFQAIYRTVDDACAASVRVRLALPEGIDIRCGLGAGESIEIEPGTTASVLDGTAWWRAREAVEEAERRGARSGSARTWFIADDQEAADARRVNASLLLADDLIGALSARDKRIAAALAGGVTQREIALAEGISQAAVSQSARRTGAQTLVQVLNLWQMRD